MEKKSLYIIAIITLYFCFILRLFLLGVVRGRLGIILEENMKNDCSIFYVCWSRL